MAIYQDLVDRHGCAGAYNSVKRFVGKLRQREPEQFDRLNFLPGEEMQVDYGEGALTRVPGTDRYRNPKLPRQACFESHTLKFVGEGGNALIIGRPGTGKSHVAKAVAYQATLQGFDVRYIEADTEFARHGLGSPGEQAALLRGYLEPDLIVLDDLFLARRIEEASAELLQTVVHHLYKQRRSIVVTSNRVVQDWGKYLGDATMATTILDRLMHRAAMLEFEGKSYRLKEAASRIALNTAADS